MKTIISIFLLSSLSSIAIANDESGFFGGGGLAVTVNDDCGSYCDTSGYAFEVGYNVNKIVGIEAKFGSTEFDDDEYYENDLTYVGVNIGHTFNTSWVRFYGKLGHIEIEETDTYWNETYSDSAFALGIGASFTPFAHQSGLYFKLESMSAELFDQTIGYGQLGIGFQF